jgi:hypothetical protein
MSDYGYKDSNGTDFDDLFQPIGTATATTTGYKYGPQELDVGSRYLKGSAGKVYGTNIGYQFNNGGTYTDLGQYFEKKLPFTVTGATVTGTTTTTSTETSRYQYAVFASTGTDIGNITMQLNKTLYWCLVGGGGGGGRGTTDRAPGGGGGGGVLYYADTTPVSGNWFTISVGAGAVGGNESNNDTPNRVGGSSTVYKRTIVTSSITTEILKATGGSCGTWASRGAAGLGYYDSTLGDYTAGGNGGTRYDYELDTGIDATSSNRYYISDADQRAVPVPATVESAETSYIAKYYSGGGGGSKGRASGYNWSGGSGGGKGTGTIPNGLGGANGTIDTSPTVGGNGKWYGGGGGAGGGGSGGADFDGGAGHQGIVFVWAVI